MTSQAHLEASYVLHRRAYKETSFILDIFTIHSGRVSVVSKGNRGRNASNVATLQVFQPLLLSWKGKGELKTLTQIEVPSSPMPMRGVSLYCAYYLNELLCYLLPASEASFEVFTAYGAALEELSDGKHIEQTLRWFELILLQFLGELPDLSLDSDGKPFEINAYYRMGDTGLEKSLSQADKGSSIAWTGNTIFQAAKLLFEDGERVASAQLKSFNRFFLRKLLGGRTLKSKETLKELLAMQKS